MSWTTSLWEIFKWDFCTRSCFAEADPRIGLRRGRAHRAGAPRISSICQEPSPSTGVCVQVPHHLCLGMDAVEIICGRNGHECAKAAGKTPFTSMVAAAAGNEDPPHPTHPPAIFNAEIKFMMSSSAWVSSNPSRRRPGNASRTNCQQLQSLPSVVLQMMPHETLHKWSIAHWIRQRMLHKPTHKWSMTNWILACTGT